MQGFDRFMTAPESDEGPHVMDSYLYSQGFFVLGLKNATGIN